MFEEGARMKAEFGADNVFDFSLGNPDVPAPPEFDTALREAAAETGPGVHGYMPNGGYPWVREALAEQVSAEQGVAVSAAEVLMTCGAAGALNVVMKALLDPGDASTAQGQTVDPDCLHGTRRHPHILRFRLALLEYLVLFA